jgi:hypothetical protein
LSFYILIALLFISSNLPIRENKLEIEINIHKKQTILGFEKASKTVAVETVSIKKI